MTAINLITIKHRTPRFGGGDNWGERLRVGILIDWLDSRPEHGRFDVRDLNRRAERGDMVALAGAALSGRLARPPAAGELAYTNRSDHALEYSERYHAHIAGHLYEDELSTGDALYARLCELAPTCLSALVNCAELIRRSGDPSSARAVLERARTIATRSDKRRHGIPDRWWISTIECDLARMGSGPDPDPELLAMVERARIPELVERLRAYGSWEAAAVPCHSVFAAATPAQRIVLHAAMRLAPVNPRPPPAAHADFTALERAERLVLAHSP